MEVEKENKGFAAICSSLIADGKKAESLFAFLNDSARIVGEHFGSDRVWFYTFGHFNGTIPEWNTKNITPFSDLLSDEDKKHYFDEKFILKRLRDLSPVMGNREGLNADTFQLTKQNGIKNFCLIPIPSAGSLWGVLGIEYVNEEFLPKELINSMDEIGLFFSGGLARFELNLKIAEEKNQESETFRRLQTLMANIPGAAYQCLNNPEWTMLFMSQGVYSLTGYRPEDFISGNVQYADIILPEFRNELWHQIQEALGNNSSFEVQYAVSVKGQIRWFWERGRKIGQDESGNSILEGFITDVTERVVNQLKIEETQEKLKKSENQLRLSFQNAPIGIGICQLDGTLININEAFAKTLGYTVRELEGRKYRDFVFSADIHEHNRIETRLKNGVITPKREKFNVPKRFIKKDATLIFTVLHTTVIFDETGIPQYAVLMLEDITSAKRSEEAALRALIEGEDKERARIAKEIHDGLSQDLTAALLSLESIRDVVLGGGDDSFGKYLTGIKFIQDAIDESRSLSHNLMPKAITDFGLVITLKSIINKYKSTMPIEVSFYDNLNDIRLPIEIEFNLYRISQECLQNIVKHASAQRVNIQIIKHPDSVIFSIEDDGTGMDLSKPNKNEGIGLFNMRNRTKALSGNFILESKPGKGTSITVEIPLNIE